MIRRMIGNIAGPMAGACITGLTRLANGHRLRPLTTGEHRALDGVVPGLDLSSVRVAEGCRLPLLPGFAAITLGNIVYVRGLLARWPATLLAHELAHVRQFSQRGWLGMTRAYATLWLEHGYAEHPLELEARAAERAFLSGRKPLALAPKVRTG